MDINISPLPTQFLIFIKLLKLHLLQHLSLRSSIWQSIPSSLWLSPHPSLDSLHCITCTVFQAMSPPLGGTLVLPNCSPARQKYSISSYIESNPVEFHIIESLYHL